jgi:hypothetical protein
MPLNLGPLGQQTILSTILLGVGIIYLTWILYTVTRVLLSTFVLPGASVSITSFLLSLT